MRRLHVLISQRIRDDPFAMVFELVLVRHAVRECRRGRRKGRKKGEQRKRNARWGPRVLHPGKLRCDPYARYPGRARREATLRLARCFVRRAFRPAHNQHRTLGVYGDGLRNRSEQKAIDGAVAVRTNDDQIDVQRLGFFKNRVSRRSGHHARGDRHVPAFGASTNLGRRVLDGRAGRVVPVPFQRLIQTGIHNARSVGDRESRSHNRDDVYFAAVWDVLTSDSSDCRLAVFG